MKVLKYLFTRKKNLCYYKNKVGIKDMEKMEKKGILDARTLACYVIDYYRKKFGEDTISPLKLQKSLYFCFAYWGGFVRKMSMGESELQKDYNELLFCNKIEAWVYGPVVPDVYHETEYYKYAKENPFGDNFIEDYINGILDDVLATNDFKLVEVSHQDKCWKKNFKPNSRFHNSEIPFEEIINEYARNY